MLREWLGETSVSEFVATHLGRAPFAAPGMARSALSALDWDALGRILAAAPDVIVVAGGALLESPTPRSGADARALLQRGEGFVVRRAERHDAALRSIATSFERELTGTARVQLFVTPAATHGFAWHYDAEEVFIAQTVGVKEYFFRKNTIDPRPVFGAQPDFSRIREERTPKMSCVLAPGDWLYLPRGWWHVAKAREDSLSISIGVERGG